MKEEDKKTEYVRYLKGKWIEAEEVTINELGVTKNEAICIVFDKLTEPYGYWKKRFKY